MIQWIRIRLPIQGTRVWYLVQGDFTCRGATKPPRHNHWALALEPSSHNSWACLLHLLKPVRLETVLHKRSHCSKRPVHLESSPTLHSWRKPKHSNEDPAQPKIKLKKKFFFNYLSVWPCHMACRILVPWPDIEPMPPTLEVRSPNHWTMREFPQSSLYCWYQCFSCSNARTSWLDIVFDDLRPWLLKS